MNRAWPALAWLSVAAFAVVAVVALTRAEWRAGASLALTPSVAAIAVITSARVAVRRDLHPGLRVAWGLFAASYATSIIADIVWTSYELSYDEPPFPSVADALYLASYPPMVAGLLFLPSAPVTTGERLRFGLDLSIVFTGTTMVVWYYVVAPTAAEHTHALAQIAAVGPVVFDVVTLAGLAIVLLRRPTANTATALAFLVAGTGAYVGGDLWYARSVLERGYEAGDPVDAVWVLGHVLTVFGAVRQAEGQGAEDAAAVRIAWDRVTALLPYVGMVLGFGMLVRLAASGSERHLGVALGAVLLCGLVVARQAHVLAENRRLHRELAVQYDKSEQLLLNILPAPIAARLKEHPGEAIAESVPEATVLFADLVGFTPLSAKTPPDRLLALLDDVFSRFDRIAADLGIEKIKTIGDAYMAASGLPVPRPDHADAAAHMALRMLADIDAVNREHGLQLKLRIGLHSGPVVAGVIGHQKFSYDLWGDTVNTASRMESHGVPGSVQVSASTRQHLGDRFVLEPRGAIEVKGKGTVETWLLVRDRNINV